MPKLYYCPAITYGGTRLYLPPWVTVKQSRKQNVEMISVPQTNSAVITSVRANQGTSLSLVCSGFKSERDQAVVLSWIEELWKGLSEKTFNLFIWSDRAWRDCALETYDHEQDLKPMTGLFNLELGIVCPNSSPDTSMQLSFTDYANEYPYSHLAGRPVGMAVEPGTLIPEVEPAVQDQCGIFVGVCDAATAEGEEHRFRGGGSLGAQWRIEGIQVTSAEPDGATGTTTLRVSTAPIGSAGSNLDCTVSQTSRFGAENSAGAITVTTGVTLYVFIPSAGGHQNVQYRVRLRAL
jgi:hypothetical protein